MPGCQIYLSTEQAAVLDREAKRTGTTRSHLIREAIEAKYSTPQDRDQIDRALRGSAGLWRDRAETGEAYVERRRSARRLRDLYPDDEPEQSDR